MGTHGFLARLVVAAALLLTLSGCDALWTGISPEKYIGQEAPMTLLLAEYVGPDARVTAERVRDDLHDKGFKRAFVIADDDEAFLCHSLYSGFDDPDYLPDKERFAAVRDTSGRTAFGRPLASPLPEPTPMTLYNLLEARGQYTVQVGVFDLYGRKRMANDYAETLRRQGWKAYVYHGDTQSLVTVDTFGREIFDNWARADNPWDPAKIISPDVNRILAALPYVNWNGHQFTKEEVDEIKITRRTSVLLPKSSSPTREITTDMSESMFRSKLVRIPVRARQPAMPRGPIPSPRGGGLR